MAGIVYDVTLIEGYLRTRTPCGARMRSFSMIVRRELHMAA